MLQKLPNNELTFFQKVWVFSDGEQSMHIEPCPIVLFGDLLFHLSSHVRTVSSSRVQRSLAVKALNREQHIKTMLLCPT